MREKLEAQDNMDPALLQTLDYKERMRVDCQSQEEEAHALLVRVSSWLMHLQDQAVRFEVQISLNEHLLISCKSF